MSNIFVIECIDKKGKCYYLDEAGEFNSNLNSLHLKKWKIQRGAENYLKSIKDDLIKENADIKKINVVERSQEIQTAFDKKEDIKFKKDFDSIRNMSTKGSVVNSGSVYRQMRLRLAEELVALSKGDSILYFPDGYCGSSQLLSIEKVEISTFSAGGISTSRLTGDNSFLPNNSELVDYFVAYAQIQNFIKQNWEIVKPLELIQISKKIADN